MAIYSSNSMRGFLDDTVSAVLPDDALEISTDYHADLLAGQGMGKKIEWNSGSAPILVDQPAASEAELSSSERSWRDVEVSATEWLVARHRDEQYMQLPTTLTAEQFAGLLAYRQALRDWPQTEGFPDSTQRPVAPPWIAEQTH